MQYTYNTKQAVFNVVWQQMKKQNFEQSSIQKKGANVCLYRGPDDRCCAVGALIPDNAYNAEWEGASYEALVNKPTVRELFNSDLDDFMRQMQWAHDCGIIPANMKARFERIADDNSLTVPE